MKVDAHRYVRGLNSVIGYKGIPEPRQANMRIPSHAFLISATRADRDRRPQHRPNDSDIPHRMLARAGNGLLTAPPDTAGAEPASPAPATFASRGPTASAARRYNTSATTKVLPPTKIMSSGAASSLARASAAVTSGTTSPLRPASAAREASSSAGSARLTDACVKM